MKDSSRIIDKERRQFLDMLSKAGIAGSLLKASPLVGGLMATRFAHAQSGTKRVIFVYTSNGAPRGKWLPTSLTTMNDATKAYLPVSRYCNFIPVKIVNGGHGATYKCLSALESVWQRGTIDHQIARYISTNRPFQTVALGVQAGAGGLSHISGQIFPSEDRPAAAYQKLFGAGTSSNVIQKVKVMDLHREALSGLKNKLGSFERNMLETHEESLNTLQNRLNNAPGACGLPAWNANGYDTQGPSATGGPGIFKHQAELQADIIVAAISCGLSNVFTLQLGDTNGGWYGHGTSYKGDYHNACHSLPSAYVEMANHMNGCVAYLIQKLIDTPDPAVPGTRLIHNTVLLQVTDMGDGAEHTDENGPNLLATAMPGFKSGTIFPQSNGTNLQLLNSLVAGLGLTSSQILPFAGGTYSLNILS